MLLTRARAGGSIDGLVEVKEKKLDKLRCALDG